MKCSVEGIAKELGIEESSAKEILKKVKDMGITEKTEIYSHPINRVLRVLGEAEVYLGEKRVYLHNLAVKDGEFYLSYKTNGEQYTAKVTPYSEFKLSNGYGINEDSLKDLLEKVVFLDVFDGYEAMAHDITNTPGEIKKLAAELEELSDIPAKQKRILRDRISWLNEVTDKMIPEINVYLNKKAEKTGGFLDIKGNSADMFIGASKKGSKSPLEVYVHELFHAVTSYAINSRDPDIAFSIKRIEAIRENFINSTKAEDLVKASKGKLTIEEANAMLDYIVDEHTGLHEFVSLAMSNEAVSSILEKKESKPKKTEYPNLVAEIADKLKSILDKVIAKITKEPRDNDLNRMVFLVERISRANKRGLEVKKRSILGNLLVLLEPAEKPLREVVKKGIEKAKNRTFKTRPPRGRPGDIWYGLKLAMRGLYDEKARANLSAVGALSGIPILSPEGTIATTLRDIFESDRQQDVVEMMGLLSQQIDQGRELRYTQMQKTIVNGFTNELSEKDEVALADVVIDTDMNSLFPDYSMEELHNLLADEGELRQEIAKRKDELKQKTDIQSFRYYWIQAQGLANYMVTGVARPTQLLNASNIAMKLNTAKHKRNVSKDIIRDIDQLTTLVAMQKANKKSKKNVVDLMEIDNDGVQNLIMHLGGAKLKADEKIFNKPGEQFHKIKGYSSEIYDEDIELAIAPLSQAEELSKVGYRLERKLEKHSNDKNKEPMGLFINDNIVKPSFHRVGLRITNRSGRGTTLRESYGIAGEHLMSKKVHTDINNINAEVIELTTKMQLGTYKPGDEENINMAPVLSATGKVKDYRYMLDKNNKKQLLGLDRRASHVLGRTVASIYDKAQTKTFNEAMMELIEEDIKKNNPKNRTITLDNKVYIKIEKDSPNKEVRELWSVIPRDIRQKYPNGFMLRRDLMHSYLGYRELSIADFPLIKQLPASIKHGFQVAEKIWKLIVRVSKVDIVIRTPAVLIGNVVSNFMLSAMTGENVVDIARLQLKGIKELNDYISMTKELVNLQAKVDAGKGSVEIQRKISMLKNNLETSSAKDLVDAGFYTTILEELESTDENIKNVFGKRIGDMYDKTPKLVREGIDVLYLTGNTKFFKFMSAATQYSDFVARYAQYHLMLKRGVKKYDAIKTVRDAYINYNKPNSRFIEWANQMGFVMFTKYFVRIQRAIKEQVATHPLKVIAAILGQEYVIGDVDDITDQSIISKDLDVLFYNPLDQLVRAITPPSVELVSTIIH